MDAMASEFYSDPVFPSLCSTDYTLIMPEIDSASHARASIPHRCPERLPSDTLDWFGDWILEMIGSETEEKRFVDLRWVILPSIALSNSIPVLSPTQGDRYTYPQSNTPKMIPENPWASNAGEYVDK